MCTTLAVLIILLPYAHVIDHYIDMGLHLCNQDSCGMMGVYYIFFSFINIVALVVLSSVFFRTLWEYNPYIKLSENKTQIQENTLRIQEIMEELQLPEIDEEREKDLLEELRDL